MEHSAVQCVSLIISLNPHHRNPYVQQLSSRIIQCIHSWANIDRNLEYVNMVMSWHRHIGNHHSRISKRKIGPTRFVKAWSYDWDEIITTNKKKGKDRCWKQLLKNCLFDQFILNSDMLSVGNSEEICDFVTTKLCCTVTP